MSSSKIRKMESSDPTSLKILAGTKVLLLGDSYNHGVGGTTDRGWGYYFTQLTGCDSRIVHQNSGGFAAVPTSTNATYQGKVYSQVINLVPAEDYKYLIVQAGWNDLSENINTGGASAIVTGVTNFITAAKARFPKATIVIVPTYNDTNLNAEKRSRIHAMFNTALSKGIKTSTKSFTWMWGTSMNASDGIHLTDAGYQKLGGYIASFVLGWDGILDVGNPYADTPMIQYGGGTTNGRGQLPITFATPFVNQPYVVCTVRGDSQASVFDAHPGNVSKTGFTIYCTRDNGSTVAVGSGLPVQYIAVGI